MSRKRRLGVLALAFLIAGCAIQSAAPRPSATPTLTAQPTATARPTNAVNDIVSVRSEGGAGGTILAIDARTGETLRTLNDGAISGDGATVYWTESSSGGTKTTVHVADLASAKELRTFVVDGDLRPAGMATTFSPLAGDGRLSPDGRHLALTNVPYQIDGAWVTKLAVVDTTTGAVETSAEFRGDLTYAFVTFTPDARSLILEQYGEGAARTRGFDVATGKLFDLAGSGLVVSGFRTAAVLSPDRRWVFRLDAGSQTTNCTSTDGPSRIPNGTPPYVVAIDLATRRATKVALPAVQLSADFEKYMLWSLMLTPDGSTLYAANPALGVIDEIDARQLSVRRTAAITVARHDDGLLAAIGRAIFPAADAKRYLVGGAALSPDGRTLYAAAHDGVAVIETATLASRAVWQQAHQFDTLRLSPDGARLYAMDNMAGKLVILDASSGASLGDVKLAYAPAILRIEPSR